MDYPIAIMLVDTTRRLIKRAERSKHSAVKGYLATRSYIWCVSTVREGYLKLVDKDEFVDVRWVKHI